MSASSAGDLVAIMSVSRGRQTALQGTGLSSAGLHVLFGARPDPPGPRSHSGRRLGVDWSPTTGSRSHRASGSMVISACTSTVRSRTFDDMQLDTSDRAA